MEAKSNSFGFVEQENLIKVPFFQRPYVWDKDNWDQLFNDLLDSYKNNKEPFLGSITLKQLSTTTGSGSTRTLVDGQQRLTTFSILIKTLYDQLALEDRVDYAKYLYKSLIKEKIPKIEHSKADKIFFWPDFTI